jgi:coenzyme F420-reducing hydrogenase delta subunit/Pyruvate/2-oxoacid:ferredoxin oxidoreductase delta subunit
MVLGRGDSAAACSQVFEKLEMESYRFYAMPEEIQRSTGQYLVYIEGESYRTSSIVLAPASKTEENEVRASLRVNKPHMVGARHADGLYTLKPGILLCDPDVEPSLVGPAAAAQTLAWMGQLKSRGFTNTAFVDPVYCRSCGTCIEICEYGAPELHEDESQGNVWIDPALCQGCGTCITHCPSGAIRNQMSTDAQLAASLREINLDEKWLRGQKRIVVLTCNWNGYLNLEAAGKKRGEYSPAIFPLRVSCLGEITSGIILKAFQFGADGVLILGCNEEECHYCFGSRLAEDVVVEARNLVRLLGLQEDRLKILRLSARDELSFEQIANTFIDTIRED